MRLSRSESLETAAQADDLGVHVNGQPMRRRRQGLAIVFLWLSMVKDKPLALVLPQKPRRAPLITVLDLRYDYLLG